MVKNDAKLALVSLGHRHLSGSGGQMGQRLDSVRENGNLSLQVARHLYELFATGETRGSSRGSTNEQDSSRTEACHCREKNEL